MSRIHADLKAFTPQPVWDAGRNAWYGIGRLAQWPSAAFHPWRRSSQHMLTGLKGCHAGERCFIIGNGPSLKCMDLSLLRGEFTFGMNRIYLMFAELGYHTTYYVCVNSLVIEQCAADIRSLPEAKFISWRSHNLIEPTRDMAFLYTTYTGPKFANDARGRLWEGGTVTYVTLQLAFHMGFKQVILIGVDHNYTTQGKPNTTVISPGADPNHFDERYFGQGFRWQLPDLETSERAYRLARRAYEGSGRQVLDATVDGKLNVFPKISYSGLFS
jgi:hypothetical protein